MNSAISDFAAKGAPNAGFAWMWLGQGGFAYRFNAVTIVVDPYLSDAVDSLPRAYPQEAEPSDIAGNLLLTTHDHDDHFDPETVSQAVVKGMKIGGPPSCQVMSRGMNLPEDVFLTWTKGETIDFGEVSITAVKAEHEGLSDAMGFILRGAGVTVYHVGDCEATEEVFSQTVNLMPDYLFVPINGKWGNLNPEEATRLAVSTGAKTAVPMHYDLFVGNQEDPERFREEVQMTGVDCSVRIPVRWETVCG